MQLLRLTKHVESLPERQQIQVQVEFGHFLFRDLGVTHWKQMLSGPTLGKFLVTEGSTVETRVGQIDRMQSYMKSRNMSCVRKSGQSCPSGLDDVIAQVRNQDKSGTLFLMLRAVQRWCVSCDIAQECEKGTLLGIPAQVLHALDEGLPRPHCVILLTDTEQNKVNCHIESMCKEHAPCVVVPTKGTEHEVHQRLVTGVRSGVAWDQREQLDSWSWKQCQVPQMAFPAELEYHPFPASSQHGLETMVKQAHDKMGHPHTEQFVRILRAAGATDLVLEVAKKLRCSVCESIKPPKPQRMSALTPALGFNQTVGIDLFFISGPEGAESIP
eukprot:6483405-Amphidinium_carterae.1